MRATLLAAVFLAGLIVGAAVTYAVLEAKGHHRVRVVLKLDRGPSPTVISLPGMGNISVWNLDVTAALEGSRLNTPLAVKDVKVYVKVYRHDLNILQWVRAKGNVVGGISYTYWGDMLVEPHSKAELHISISTPREMEVRAVVVVVEFEGGEIAYSNILTVPGTYG